MLAVLESNSEGIGDVSLELNALSAATVVDRWDRS